MAPMPIVSRCITPSVARPDVYARVGGTPYHELDSLNAQGGTRPGATAIGCGLASAADLAAPIASNVSLLG
jgi:hypothetical protein